MLSMSKKTLTIALAVLVLVIATTMVVRHAFAEPVQKKVIYYGWGTRDTMYVRDHWQEIEKLPLDGTAIAVAIDRTKPISGDGATANNMGWHLFGPVPFRMDDFRPALADLKAPKWSKFKSNFLIACICSTDQDHGFDWFDDNRWKTVLNNWIVYAKLAKGGGCKGIIIDPEQYGSDHGTESSKGFFFSYKEMKRRNNASFDEMCLKVRQRGRELMQATAKVFPDIEVPMLMASSYVWYTQLQNWYAEDKNAPCPLELNHFVLFPAFLDGMIEGSDKRTRFIDFSEPAYGTVQRQYFLEWYHRGRNKALEYTSVPELYQDRVSVGFPLWMDCNYDKKTWDTTDFSKNYYTPEALKTALTAALDITDEYVWIYSEHNVSFFPVANLPDAYISAIREARASVR